MIPEVYITALPNTSEVSYASAQLHIQNLTRTNNGSWTSADLKWDLVYNGIYPISETVMIAPFGTEDWTRLPARQVPSTAISDTSTIPLSGLAAGQYTIRVDVDAADANSDQATLDLVMSDVAKRPQIRIT